MKHSVGRPYVKSNYRELLIKMHEDGTIKATREGGKPIRKNTFPPDVKITFPNNKGG